MQPDVVGLVEGGEVASGLNHGFERAVNHCQFLPVLNRPPACNCHQCGTNFRKIRLPALAAARHTARDGAPLSILVAAASATAPRYVASILQ